MLIGARGGDIAPGLADDHRQLDFIVQQLGQGVVEAHRCARRVHCRRRLGEELRDLGQLGRRPHGACALGDVVDVVAADAEDVLPGPGNGRQQLHAVGRQAGRVIARGATGGRHDLRPAADQIDHRAGHAAQVGDTAIAQPHTGRRLATARKGDEFHGRLLWAPA